MKLNYSNEFYHRFFIVILNVSSTRTRNNIGRLLAQVNNILEKIIPETIIIVKEGNLQKNKCGRLLSIIFLVEFVVMLYNDFLYKLNLFMIQNKINCNLF